MNVPKKCCYPQCDECPYLDCRFDGVFAREVFRQDRFDASLQPNDIRRAYNQTVEGRARTARYNRSEKGKLSRQRYERSDRGKQRHNDYNHSPAGIAARKKYEEKRKALNRMKRLEADAVGE